MTAPTEPCPLCFPARERIVFETDLVRAIWDGVPLNPGHILIVTRRHVATWFDASSEEQHAIVRALGRAREEILSRFRADGFNIGVDVGEPAGQTVLHLHVHLIPRRCGDVPHPTAGVRYVIPSTANYRREDAAAGTQPRLVPGGDDPLLPELIDQMAAACHADVAVGFVLPGGVTRLEEHFRDLLARGGRLRLLTGDYLGVTDPDALVRLLDLPGDRVLKVFETEHPPDAAWPAPRPLLSFHPKAYVFRRQDGQGIAYVGSSNLSEPALTTGIEWNYRVVSSAEGNAFRDILCSFERLLNHPAVVDLTPAWIDRYRSRRPDPLHAGVRPQAPVEVAPEPATPVEPHSVQRDALFALTRTRTAGYRAGLVVMATGLGKTWLAAFDSQPFARVLFVAHREEILAQSLSTFRRIRPTARLGLYTGQERDPSADVIFASIQTLGRAAHLDRFANDAFDYVVVDEFHHASAPTYRRLIQHFRPRFLLGLTATPERSDGGDLLTLCEENLVYRCDLVDGVKRELLCRFEYFGVPDEVDYRNIPWRNARFDPDELTARLATRSRALNALEQLRNRGGTRTLAFCVSQRHADFMAGFFSERGLRAAAVHTGETSAPRAKSLADLASGHLDVICAVDVFNEGLDLPELDTVLMLRPTESRVLWLQQFGRGLRRTTPDKQLRVIDYIGNHRTFLLKPQTLFALPPGDREVLHLLDRVRREGRLEIAPGCFVTYDLATIDILRGLLRVGGVAAREAMSRYYDDFVERNGTRPRAIEARHDGYNPRAMRRPFGSWLGWVDSKGGLTSDQARARKNHEVFLQSLESTPMEKSYKMLTLLAMLNADRFPGTMSVDEVAAGVLNLADGNPRLLADLGANGEDRESLRRLLVAYPLRVWSEGAGTGDVPYFILDGETFRTAFRFAPEDRAPLQEMVREIADWRLADYLLRDRSGVQADEYVLRVSHAGGRPMLFLPDRSEHPAIPHGPTPLLVDGETLEADFVKVALNVVRRPGEALNRLPEILRGWFGSEAGLPGTQMEVVLAEGDGGWTIRPRGRRSVAIELWRSYMRDQIPPLFGFTFSQAVWHSGFVTPRGHVFLLVTIDKSGKSSDHRYKDRFLSPTVFQWQSQNRTVRKSKAGELIHNHHKLGVAVHLFVRKTGKLPGGGAAPFVYCGDVSFQDWQGDRPITVRWMLPEGLPETVMGQLASPE